MKKLCKENVKFQVRPERVIQFGEEFSACFCGLDYFLYERKNGFQWKSCCCSAN